MTDETGCPVCRKPRVRRGGHALQTCGETPCSIELRARKVRGNAYGNRGGGPKRSTDSGYSAVHARARRALRGQPCALANETCGGRLEAALRDGLPAEELRVDERGLVYFTGLDTERGYRHLCRSHHAREGALRAAGTRSTAMAVAASLERLTAHACALDPCALCADLAAYDDLVSRLHLHVIPRREGDGLALPWTGQGRTE